MHKDLQPPLTLTLTEGGVSLPVNRFTGREALNEPYRFDIELSHCTLAIDLDLLHLQPAFLHLGDDSGIHGIIRCVSHPDAVPFQAGYRLNLVPHLQALEQPRCRRVFHDLSVPVILRQLLEEHGLPVDSYRFELPLDRYPLRPLCIQYDESDLYFLQRLCEEEGIHYHFEHQRDRHVAVFADDSEKFVLQPVVTPYRHPTEPALGQPAIRHLSECHYANLAQPTRTQNPSVPVGTPCIDQQAANQAHGLIHSAESRRSSAQAYPDQLGRRALERLRSQQRQIVGHSDQPRLHSGQILQVLAHPLSRFNDQWLLTEVRHQWQQALKPVPSPQPWWEVTEQLSDGSFTCSMTAPLHQGYRNQFKAIPWSVVFRPALRHPKPCIPGYQSASAAGCDGQPATLDAQGRIKVHLAWDRQSAGDPHSGHWLPIAHQGFSDGFYPYSLPIAGSEVSVSFIDSDPDRPVVWSVANLPPDPQAASPSSGLYLDGQRLAENLRRVHVEPGQTLLIQENQPLTLTANGTRIRLSPGSITLSTAPPGSTHVAAKMDEATRVDPGPGESSLLFDWLVNRADT
jgi:type VI secretion system secreted protein VgrG